MKSQRAKRGLTQSTLALAMGMNQRSYSRIESGARCPTKQQEASFKMAMIIHEAGLFEFIDNRG